jgi:acetyl-CoA acetyltransferase family protein
MFQGEQVWIVDAVRTPIGRLRGGLATRRTDDLAGDVLRALAARNVEAAAHLDHVVMGATNQAGEDNRNVARMALLLADLPDTVPAVTVNRLCGSGLEAVTDAVMRIWTGDARAVMAGGVESMTRAPFVFAKPDEAFSSSAPTVYNTSLGWRFENPAMAARFELQSMGRTAENVAQRAGIDREAQDAWALRSHQRALAAWDAGAFSAEVIPVPLPPARRGEPPGALHRDEGPRADTTLDALARLRPVFLEGGTVTAGNSSPLNDGASALLLVSATLGRNLGLEPMARVVSFATAGVHPNVMGEGPIPAGQKALARAGWQPADLGAVELNEAFAAQVLAGIAGLGLSPEQVNPLGGAIALGHPIGCSGARVLTTLVHHMRAQGLRRGMAALCIGVGQGIALTVERD